MKRILALGAGLILCGTVAAQTPVSAPAFAPPPVTTWSNSVTPAAVPAPAPAPTPAPPTTPVEKPTRVSGPRLLTPVVATTVKPITKSEVSTAPRPLLSLLSPVSVDPTPRTILAPAAPPAALPATSRVSATPLVVDTITPTRYDPLQPLGGLLTMPLPTSPTVGAESACSDAGCKPCGAPLFTTATRSGSGAARPCLDRLVNWLTYQPGPSVYPILTPTPYHAPLLAYFPCAPEKNPGQPAGCGATGAGGIGGVGGVGRAGLGGVAHMGVGAGACQNGTCDAPRHKGFGLCTQPSQMPATTGSLGYICGPVAIPLPAGCIGSGNSSSCAVGHPAGCGRSAFDRMLGLFSPCHHGTCANATVQPSAGPASLAVAPNTAAISTVPVIMGYQQPAGAGYRFANPNSARPVNGTGPGTGSMSPSAVSALPANVNQASSTQPAPSR